VESIEELDRSEEIGSLAFALAFALLQTSRGEVVG